MSKPKATRGRRSAKKPLRELGKHPDDDQPINIYDGRYGIYFQHNKTNVKLPEGETAESMSLEKALKLLEDKGGTRKKTTRKKSTTAKKTTAKKTTVKKTTAKKTTTAKKKTTTRKKSTTTKAKKTADS